MKEFKSEKKTVFILAGVKRPQYKREKRGVCKRGGMHRETLKDTKKRRRGSTKDGRKTKAKT
jgi:hypothetical protein